jgi:hypothetical protein
MIVSNNFLADLIECHVGNDINFQAALTNNDPSEMVDFLRNNLNPREYVTITKEFENEEDSRFYAGRILVRLNSPHEEEAQPFNYRLLEENGKELVVYREF